VSHISAVLRGIPDFVDMHQGGECIAKMLRAWLNFQRSALTHFGFSCD
jgi:hypothetical protein